MLAVFTDVATTDTSTPACFVQVEDPGTTTAADGFDVSFYESNTVTPPEDAEPQVSPPPITIKTIERPQKGQFSGPALHGYVRYPVGFG